MGHTLRASGLLLILVLVAAPAAHAAPPSAGPLRVVDEPPRVQVIDDARDDATSVSDLAAGLVQAADVRRVRVERESNELLVDFRVADLRRLPGLAQRATVSIRGVGSPRQDFTTAGRSLLKTSTNGERRCGGVDRRPRADVLRMAIPFSCVRTTPGRYPRLVAMFAVTPAGSFETLALDTVRGVRAAPR